jgi:hypothetical protein
MAPAIHPDTQMPYVW